MVWGSLNHVSCVQAFWDYSCLLSVHFSQTWDKILHEAYPHQCDFLIASCIIASMTPDGQMDGWGTLNHLWWPENTKRGPSSPWGDQDERQNGPVKPCNIPIDSWFALKKWWFSIVMLVYRRECLWCLWCHCRASPVLLAVLCLQGGTFSSLHSTNKCWLIPLAIGRSPWVFTQIHVQLSAEFNMWSLQFRGPSQTTSMPVSNFRWHALQIDFCKDLKPHIYAMNSLNWCLLSLMKIGTISA